jgi:hypothetical protein
LYAYKRLSATLGEVGSFKLDVLQLAHVLSSSVTTGGIDHNNAHLFYRLFDNIACNHYLLLLTKTQGSHNRLIFD